MRIHRLLLLLMLWPVLAMAAAPSPFVPGSMEKIRQQLSGRAHMLVLWSTDCIYCAEELRYLGKLKKQRPTLPLILIATDDISRSDLIQSMLADYRLSSVTSFAFADDYTERLRWEIDPAWYGELPRSYLVAGDGSRRALSGQLGPKVLEPWLAKHLTIRSR
jgi:hypothetical protein